MVANPDVRCQHLIHGCCAKAKLITGTGIQHLYQETGVVRSGAIQTEAPLCAKASWQTRPPRTQVFWDQLATRHFEGLKDVILHMLSEGLLYKAFNHSLQIEESLGRVMKSGARMKNRVQATLITPIRNACCVTQGMAGGHIRQVRLVGQIRFGKILRQRRIQIKDVSLTSHLTV
jgi:hypothetical protein